MKFIKGGWLGLWSGLLLSGALKWIEAVTGKHVYTLLLNVDFIPILGEKNWQESALLVFHLLVAIVIGIAYVFLAARRLFTFGQRFLISLALTLLPILLYFPLSAAAVTPITAVDDLEAFLYWLFGHLLFALMLPILEKLFERKKPASQREA